MPGYNCRCSDKASSWIPTTKWLQSSASLIASNSQLSVSMDFVILYMEKFWSVKIDKFGK